MDYNTESTNYANLLQTISDDLDKLIKGVIEIETFLKKNPPPEYIFECPNISSLDFYIPSMADEPPIKRRRLNS